MLYLKGEIPFIVGNDAEVNNLTISTSNADATLDGLNPMNNISADISIDVNARKNGGSPFIIGASKVGSGDYYTEKEKFFIGNIVADKNGDFNNTYLIEFTAKSTITIVFDTAHNQFPKTIELSGSVGKPIIISDDDPVWTIVLPYKEEAYYSLSIKNWNAPNYPLRIQGIYSELKLNLDYTNIISYSFEEPTKPSLGKYDFGYLSAQGSLEVVDADGELYDYMLNGVLKKNVRGYMEVCNDGIDVVSGAVKNDFYLSSWDYDIHEKTINFSLSDIFPKLQSVIFQGFTYFESKGIERKLSYANGEFIFAGGYKHEYSPYSLCNVALILNYVEYCCGEDSNGSTLFRFNYPDSFKKYKIAYVTIEKQSVADIVDLICKTVGAYAYARYNTVSFYELES